MIQIVSAAMHNRQLRQEFNDVVQPSISKNIENILSKEKYEVEEAKKSLEVLINVYRKIEVESYNFNQDEKGYYFVQPFVEEIDSNIKNTSKPNDINELILSIRELLSQFKRAIEDNGGNKLLYKKTEPISKCNNNQLKKYAQIFLSYFNNSQNNNFIKLKIYYNQYLVAMDFKTSKKI